MDYDLRKDMFENYLTALVKSGRDMTADGLAREARKLVDLTVEQFAKYDEDSNPLRNTAGYW